MTSILLLTSSLAFSALAPAPAPASAPAPHVVPASPLVSLTPSSIRLRAERTDTGVALSLV